MMKNILNMCLLASIIYGADLIKSGNIVIDTSTNLEWQDNKIIKKNWKNAIDYCQKLNLKGKNDWRLPNKNELLSLTDDSKYHPSIKEDIFKNTAPNHYWSSTSYISYLKSAWSVDFSSSTTDNYHKYRIFYVRCVRSI